MLIYLFGQLLRDGGDVAWVFHPADRRVRSWWRLEGWVGMDLGVMVNFVVEVFGEGGEEACG